MRDLDEFEVSGRRKQRTVAIVALSVLVIAGVAVATLRPHLPGRVATGVAVPSVPTPRDQLSPTIGQPGRTTQVIDVQFLDQRRGFAFMRDRPGTSASGLFATTDAGATWDLVFEGPSGRFHFFDAGHGILTAGVTFTTADAGRTWTPLRGPEKSEGPTQFAFASRLDGLALVYSITGTAETPLRLYRTADGGTTWDLVLSAPPNRFGLQPSDLVHLGLGYASRSLAWITSFTPGDPVQGVSISLDGGGTWTQFRLPPPGGAMVAAESLLTSVGGQPVAFSSWVPVTAPRPGQTSPGVDVKGSAYLYRLTDRGWSPAHLVDDTVGGSALTPGASGAVWVAVGHALYEVGAKGIDWHRLQLPAPQSLEHLAWVDGDLFAYDAVGRSIVTSGDGGNTWRSIPPPKT